MEKLSSFPAMPSVLREHKIPITISDDANLEQILCGGCGAKVGSDLLDQVLQNIGTNDDRSILPDIGDDAAIIEVENKRQVLTTDHLREFNSDLWSYAHITAVHSLGDIWAMGSRPKYALLNIILPEANKSIQANWLEEIMDAANYTFLNENISLIGGHTTQGAELTIGVTLLGDMVSKPTEISNAKIIEETARTIVFGSELNIKLCTVIFL